MRNFFGALVLAVVMFVASSARADIKSNKEAGVQVDIPHSWTVKPDGQKMWAEDPKKEAGVLFVVSDAADMKKVGDDIDAMLAKLAKDVKWGAQNKVTLNGLDGIAMEGTATIQGKPAKMGAVILLQKEKKKGVFLLGFVDADKEKAHDAELTAIVKSLAPIK